MKKLSIILTLVIAVLFVSCCDKNACDDKTNDATAMNTTMNDLLTRRSVRSYTDEVPPVMNVSPSTVVMRVVLRYCAGGRIRR